MSIYSTFDQTELDREYSPSSCIEDINVFLDAYAAVSHSTGRTKTSSWICFCHRRGNARLCTSSSTAAIGEH